MTTLDEQFEDVYAPLAPFSDFKKGEHITYQAGGQTRTGAIVWVENEVMAALEKEHQQQKPVLFPIKLDETVMQTNLPWAANIRRTRHIGDFTNWKNHDDYQKSLNRLLRDLKASSQP